jgi:molybdopterin-binding protein
LEEAFMKYGARNQLIGTVKKIKSGQIMGQVTLTIPADSIMNSVMTMESIEDLGIKEGDKVKVVVKAINVLLVRE